MSYIICLFCNGTGYTEKLNSKETNPHIILCEICKGFGKHRKRRVQHGRLSICNSCRGLGINQKTKNLTLCSLCNGVGINASDTITCSSQRQGNGVGINASDTITCSSQRQCNAVEIPMAKL